LSTARASRRARIAPTARLVCACRFSGFSGKASAKARFAGFLAPHPPPFEKGGLREYE